MRDAQSHANLQAFPYLSKKRGMASHQDRRGKRNKPESRGNLGSGPIDKGRVEVRQVCKSGARVYHKSDLLRTLRSTRSGASNRDESFPGTFANQATVTRFVQVSEGPANECNQVQILLTYVCPVYRQAAIDRQRLSVSSQQLLPNTVTYRNLPQMCDFTKVEYKCSHLRYIVRAWCVAYQRSHVRCPLNVVAM